MQHVDAWVRMMNIRLSQHPEWFRSDRICFVDSRVPQYWQRDWPKFETCQLLPANALDYYYGKKPSYCVTYKRWGVDIDDIYIPLSIGQKHWVALHISIPKRHIVVYDSLPSTIRKADLAKVLEPYAVMIPYLLNEAALTEEKHLFPKDKFTFDRPTKGVPHQDNGGDCGVFVLKYIECLSLGYDTFPSGLRPRNVLSMREKIASDLFSEIQCRGPIDNDDWDGLDMYDGV